MSFSVEFWGGYDFIYNTFQSHRLGLKDLIYMFLKKYECEVEYAKSLKKIYDMNYAVTKMPSLLNGILTFKNDLYNQYEYTMEFTSNLQDEIIKPLENILTKQSNLGKYLNNEARKIEKEFRNSVDKLEKSRLKFHSSAKLAEDAKIQSELAKINTNFLPEVRTKIEIKAQNLLKEAKENERFYIANINIANSTREVYIETMKKMMNEFQKLEENLIDVIKDSLRKYIIYQVALLRNLQYDIEKKASAMENINILSDIRNFIEKNSTSALPPYKFEFVPYLSEFENKLDNEYIIKIPKEIQASVKQFISNVFYIDPPEMEPDSIEQKIFNEIEAIVNLAWQGKQLPEEEKIIFAKFLKEKKYRRFFLNCLNKFRMSGLFTLEEKSYLAIGDLLNISLNQIYLDRDYDSAKNCMTISQALYKTASEPNKPRKFLQALIDKHPMWKKTEFWEDFLKYNINEELHNQKNYNLYTFESQDEKSKRLKSIIVSQLNSFSYNMISFNLNKIKAQEIILYFGKYFDIDSTKIEEIKDNVEEFSVITENNLSEEINDSLKTNETNLEGINSKDFQQEKDYSDYISNNSNLDMESKNNYIKSSDVNN